MTRPDTSGFRLKGIMTDIWPEKDLINIREKYKPYFSLIDDMLLFVPEFIPEGDLSINSNEQSCSSAIITLFIKSYKTIRAIKVLCMHGLSTEANALLRTVMECLIGIIYLSKGDKELNGMKYYTFCHIQKVKLMNSLKSNPQLKDMVTAEAEQKIKVELEVLKNKIGEDEFSKIYRSSHWSGMSIETVAKKINLTSIYDLPFRLSSQATHATDFNDHFEYNNGFIIKIFPEDRWTLAILTNSISMFLSILLEVDHAFLLGMTGKISSLTDRFKKIMEQ